MSRFDYLFDTGGADDAPKWFRDELDERVRSALAEADARGGGERRERPDEPPLERTPIMPEYLLGSTPSHASSMAEGGLEHLFGSASRPGYRATMWLPPEHAGTKLPGLEAGRRRSLTRSTAGPRALSGFRDVDARIAFFTTAPRLPRALLKHDEFARAFAAALPFGPSALIHDDLEVELADARDPAAVRAGMLLARAFRTAALGVIGDPEATAVVGFQTQVVDGAQIGELMTALVDATSWLAGDAARVGDGAEARLTLDDGGGEFQATLGATIGSTASAAGDARVRLGLRAALPDDVQPFTLKPQGRFSFFARLREVRIGDAAVDEAFLIDTSDVDTLLAARSQLARLAERETTIVAEPGTLVVDVADVSVSAADVVDAATAALELWRSLIVRARW